MFPLYRLVETLYIYFYLTIRFIWVFLCLSFLVSFWKLDIYYLYLYGWCVSYSISFSRVPALYFLSILLEFCAFGLCILNPMLFGYWIGWFIAVLFSLFEYWSWIGFFPYSHDGYLNTVLNKSDNMAFCFWLINTDVTDFITLFVNALLLHGDASMFTCRCTSRACPC